MSAAAAAARLGRALPLLAIHLYRAVFAAHVAGSCRHLPSCSEYARQAIERHGARRGVALAARRLLRCHPLGTSGWDPVP